MEENKIPVVEQDEVIDLPVDPVEDIDLPAEPVEAAEPEEETPMEE